MIMKLASPLKENELLLEKARHAVEQGILTAMVLLDETP